jgi:hypothetical protein
MKRKGERRDKDGTVWREIERDGNSVVEEATKGILSNAPGPRRIWNPRHEATQIRNAGPQEYEKASPHTRSSGGKLPPEVRGGAIPTVSEGRQRKAREEKAK